jgi:hypothetical protein
LEKPQAEWSDFGEKALGWKSFELSGAILVKKRSVGKASS